MRHRAPSAAARDRAREEGSLSGTTFVGSFPAADFRTTPSFPEIAFVGRSNVGKSSLINAFVGRKAIARTSRTPGKTQACNVYRVDDAYYLVDLPGYGYARASKETRSSLRRLIRAYIERREALAGVVWLLDIRHDPSADDLAMGDLLSERGRPVLVALTKADKIPSGRRHERLTAIARAVGIEEDQCLITSIVKKEGIQSLRASAQQLLRVAGRGGGVGRARGARE